jgi:hypothetical protein
MAGAASPHARFAAAVERALGGDAALLDGFGLVKTVLISPSWEDRTALDGKGTVDVSSRRLDRGGVPVGCFRAKAQREELAAVLQRLHEVALLQLVPLHSEPYEPRVLLAAVCGGATFAHATAVRPGQTPELDPLLLAIARLDMLAYQKPLATLTVGCAMPEGVVRGAPTPVLLRLQNQGTEGYFLANPATAPNRKDADAAELTFAPAPDAPAGQAPVPVAPERAFLRARGKGRQPSFLFIGPGETVEVALEADVAPSRPGVWYFGAELRLDSGAPSLAGRPHLRVSASSGDVQLTVP